MTIRVGEHRDAGADSGWKRGQDVVCGQPGSNARQLDVAERCAEAGVALVSGVPFFPDDRGRSYLRICFSRPSPSEIEEGVRILGRVLREEL